MQILHFHFIVGQSYEPERNDRSIRTLEIKILTCTFVFKIVILSSESRLTHHSSYIRNFSYVWYNYGFDTLHTTRPIEAIIKLHYFVQTLIGRQALIDVVCRLHEWFTKNFFQCCWQIESIDLIKLITTNHTSLHCWFLLNLKSVSCCSDLFPPV